MSGVGALDVHKAQVTACVRVPAAEGRREPHLAEFSTTVAGLMALHDWLAAHRVTHVAMEATGVYWPDSTGPRNSVGPRDCRRCG